MMTRTAAADQETPPYQARGMLPPGLETEAEAITVRRAHAQDASLLLRFIQAQAAHDGSSELAPRSVDQIDAALFGADPLAHAAVVEVDGAPAGYALYFRSFSSFLQKPCLWLDDLYVDEAFRGRGLGRTLMAFVTAEARRLGCGRLDWHVAADNDGAVAFYEKLGASISPRTRLCRLTEDQLADF